MIRTKAEIMGLIGVFHQNLYGHSRGVEKYKKLKKAELEKVLADLTEKWSERMHELTRQQGEEAATDAKIKREESDFFMMAIGLIIWIICLVNQDMFWYVPGGDFDYFFWILIVVIAIWQFCVFPFYIYQLGHMLFEHRLKSRAK